MYIIIVQVTDSAPEQGSQLLVLNIFCGKILLACGRRQQTFLHAAFKKLHVMT